MTFQFSFWQFDFIYFSFFSLLDDFIRSSRYTELPWKIHLIGIYLLRVSTENTRVICKICSKLTIKIPGRSQWRHFEIINAKFQQISYIILVFPLLDLKSKWRLGHVLNKAFKISQNKYLPRAPLHLYFCIALTCLVLWQTSMMEILHKKLTVKCH